MGALTSALSSSRQTSILPFRDSSKPSSNKGGNLVVVGMGMAAFGLVDRMSRMGSLGDYNVTLIGDEPSLPYDRVNLSRLFDGASESDLLLAPELWYRERDIDLRRGCRVLSIDREAKTLTDSNEQTYQYDNLVLATGSHALVPPIEGVSHEGVFVYRTITDLSAIQQYVQSTGAKSGAVIGGGLLGLEAAKVLTDLGAKCSVIEMAPGLMPRQLDAEGAVMLRRRVESLGLDIQLVRRTESISRESPEDPLTLSFSNAEDLKVDVLVIAAGIRPNDQLAEQCDLARGERGGFAVDETLATSDPNIFAIGECASFNDHVYGLAAPCYRMADVLASRFSGESTTFSGADESAELKLLGVQVATLGKTIGDSPDVSTIVHQSETGYRKVLVREWRVVGASCVGEWEELPQIRRAIHRKQFLWPWQRTRFARHGSPWAPGGALPIAEWPDDSIVCSCLGVTKAVVQETIHALPESVTSSPSQNALAEEDTVKAKIDWVAGQCGASSACGSCRGLVSELCTGSAQPVSVPGARILMVSSITALAALVLYVLYPPVAFAESVQDSWRNIDILWRDDFARQVSGFSLLGITALGMVFSLRKRFPKFKWGEYGFWRAFHGVLGTVALLAMVVHTGMRLGSNLNFMLGVCFVGTILIGAFAGLASSLENRVPGVDAALVRMWRGRLAKLHMWVTWPLPALIALHVISFYWFSD